MPDDAREIMPAGQAGQFGNLAPQLGGPGLAPSMQILFNDGLYDRVKQLAGVMARAEGFTPKHLLGKPEACFTVIMIALDAKLIPHFVARHTYQTPGGQIGFDGALVQSILEQSGRFIGAPQFEYTGDWSRVRGKFEKRTSQKGNEFIVPTWGAKEADGLGIIVRWMVTGEDRPRIWPGEQDPFLLTQCFPLNSPLWATDPKTQIAYLAIRRFANIAAPGILGAAIPDPGELIDASEHAVDVTPQPEPRREDFAPPEHVREMGRYYDVTDLDGEVHTFSDPHKAAAAVRVVLSDASRRDAEALDEAWELNEGLIGKLDETLRSELADEYTDLRDRVLETAHRAAEAAKRQENSRAGAGDDPEAKRGEAGGSAAEDPPGSSSEPLTRPSDVADASEPGDTGEGDGSSPPSEQTSQQAAHPPAAAERPELGGGASPPQSPPARNDVQGDRRAENGGGAQDPEAARKSALISVPLKGARGEPDYRTWAVALFLPKVRRETDSTELAWLLGDNVEAVEACRKGGLTGDDLAALNRTIDEAWKRCK